LPLCMLTLTPRLLGMINDEHSIRIPIVLISGFKASISCVCVSYRQQAIANTRPWRLVIEAPIAIGDCWMHAAMYCDH